MPIWKTLSIEQQPQIFLSSWRIVELPDGDRHFVGYSDSVWGGEGRMSSKIVEFDPEKMIGKTRSGRVYQLVGIAGFNMDAEYVLGRWLEVNKVTDYKDVSDEYDSFSNT